ncbi:YibE/F family protein [Azotosporobacter soli]|uniref:YibE/F family protein n=1 Tax=Azotosporobacter soli TaxID=3055040 RepID=UPI0031FF46B7
MKRLSLFLLLLLSLSFSISAEAAPAAPAIEYEKGLVLSVTPLELSAQKKAALGEGMMVHFRLTSGPDIGKEIDTINYVSGKSAYEMKVEPGDKVIVAVSHDFGKTAYNISDFDRLDYIYYLVGLFVLVLLVFARIVGLKSVIVIGVSLLIIFKFYIGQVLSGSWNLAALTVSVCAVIAVLTHLPISGWSRKTVAALLGSMSGVIIAGLLSAASVKLMHLTGLDSEEAMLLKAATLSQVDFQGILFSGMVFGALGAVMDVSISIASSLREVSAAHPEISRKQLFISGMNVGRDIMGTMSNTLILAYVGSSLPLVLLIMSQPQVSPLKIFNLSLIATEVARALTGSIGLICSIPLTALISAWLFHQENKNQ